MKIAWLVNNIAQVGGIEQVVCGLSTYFVRVFGFDVTIFSINTFEGVPFFQIDKNVKINHCKLDWRKKARSALRKTIGNVMNGLDADILLTCHSPISIGAIQNRHLFKGKIIVTQHCAYDFESRKRRLLNAFFFRFADAFVVLTKRDRDFYQKMGCSPVVIPNAIYGKVGKRATLEDKILLSAGRLTAVKGYDLLINAFAQVADKYPDWNLCICGDGEERHALEQLTSTRNVQNRVVFPGFVDVSEYMSKAGAFVISSRSEGFPLVLVEAMAHGLPVVAYAIPPVLEICPQSALLAPCGSIEALADGIEQILSSASLREKLGDYSYNRAQQYTIPVVAGKWAGLFEEVMIRKGHASWH